ncbi:D-amino-acid oxidase [Penicillium brevicompactum]|uniref:D-amino-acid oxidase n=1 Tax=Penicillium brevicompactum TaxID=5074 RepID=A0A9W9UNR7_PENBR|nr:D-amino-acid oxidase [Penicillium brevicompactum]
MKHDSIVIVGAGVIGLNVALVLAEKGHGQHTTIIAEHLPGDTSINYTSPWAGANFSAISASDDNALRWDKLGYTHLLGLAAKDGENSFVKETSSVEYWDELPPATKIDSMAGYLKDFRRLPTVELPSGVAFGITFTTVTINAPLHIKYLLERLTQEHGVQVIRGTLSKITSGFLSPRTKVVFNCTGNAAKQLEGVQDSKCFPTRGQILLARAPQIQQNTMRHGKDYETYVIPRPHSNGNVILGGFMQKGVSTADTFGEETESILCRTKAMLPALDSSNTEILCAFSGLRPSRQGGARIAREEITLDETNGQRVVVHNYGAGGTGFQAGYGMAVEAVDTVTRELQEIIPQSHL